MKCQILVGVAVVFAFTLLPAGAQVQEERTAKDHDRHLHTHNPDHAHSDERSRFYTDRQSSVVLPLPNEEDAFTFVVYGDRTGGPDLGVNILKDAVRDTNLLEPDFVMTVGDLIDGYNQTDEWLRQADEFKEIMDELLCPWFPVAGNHDVYWRGPGKPEGEHDANYEMHFGPLWYAFEHKGCMFIVLYTDEGNPETGEKNFSKPESQEMSQAQLDWLMGMLEKSEDAEHVFVFLHHPRWLGGQYGDSWEQIHTRLVEMGNVSGVFAGHIHRMRFDPRDGIDYITLATVGGYQNKIVPDAGWLHHYNIVTVRPGQVAHAALPVGEVLDVRELTGEVADQAAQLAGTVPSVSPALSLGSEGHCAGDVEISFRNPTDYSVEYVLQAESGDSRWVFDTDHIHGTLAPGESLTRSFGFERSGGLDDTFKEAKVALDMHMLLPGHRYEIPTVTTDVPILLDLGTLKLSELPRILQLDGSSHASVPSDRFDLPDGPMTLECWFRADSFGRNTGLVAKTESSEYGLFVSNAKPSFYIHLDGRYPSVEFDEAILRVNTWHHMAGVYDGKQVRLYVDGKLVMSLDHSGTRTRNVFPFIIGGDVNGQGQAASLFAGEIDGVRISSTARYEGTEFVPARDWESDGQTVLLFDMDRGIGPWIIDESSSQAHAKRAQNAALVGE